MGVIICRKRAVVLQVEAIQRRKVFNTSTAIVRKSTSFVSEGVCELRRNVLVAVRGLIRGCLGERCVKGKMSFGFLPIGSCPTYISYVQFRKCLSKNEHLLSLKGP